MKTVSEKEAGNDAACMCFCWDWTCARRAREEDSFGQLPTQTCEAFGFPEKCHHLNTTQREQFNSDLTASAY